MLRSVPEICTDAEQLYQDGSLDNKTRADKLWRIIRELKNLVSKGGAAVFDGVEGIAKAFESRNLHLSLKQHGL